MSIVLDGTSGITSPAINAGNIVGQVCFFGMTTAPDGFLKANGAAVSRTTFAALFAAIGTTYGAGDGSTTFALPDLRGEFPRGFDDGRGVDSGRGFGTAQLDQMQRVIGKLAGGGSGIFLTSNSNGDITQGNGALRFVNGRTTASRGTNTSFTYNLNFDNTDSPDARTSATTSGETRSRNVALLACIKF